MIDTGQVLTPQPCCASQDDTLRLLQRVQPKRRNSLHQHTIGKGWAMSASSLSTTGAKPKTQKSPKRAGKTPSDPRQLSIGSCSALTRVDIWMLFVQPQRHRHKEDSRPAAHRGVGP